jgi:hypothetical protein
VLGALALADVLGTHPQLDEWVREAADRRRIRTAVVVEDDDHPRAGVADVVEGLVGHAAGHRPVAEDGHDPAAVLAV